MINKFLYYTVFLLSANIYSMRHDLNYNLGIGNDMQITTTTSGNTSNLVMPCNYRPYKCEVKGCNHAAKTKGNLKIHMKFHSDDKPYKCKVENCNMDFKVKSSLNRHMATHSNDRPYKCKVENCGYTAKIKDDLNKHIKRHSNDRPYKCKKCEFKAKYSRDLVFHIALKHNIIRPKYRKKYYRGKYKNIISRLQTSFDKIQESSDSIHPVIIDLTDDDHIKKKEEEIKPVKKYKCKKCEFMATYKQDIIYHAYLEH